MNPYSRFTRVSNCVSAALIVGGLTLFGLPVFEAIQTTAGGAGPAMWAATAGAVGVLVVFWLALTEAIFPTLFRFNAVRKIVLGKYYVEGTWLQAERGPDGEKRLAVIDVQPDGNSFIFSGYALNRDLEVESNTLIELSKFDWPFMTYKYRNSLSDGADGQREGVGELQFEMNRAAAVRYNGFAQFVKNAARLKIEGAKLVRNTEVKKLRSLDGRKAIFEKYWELFFNASIRPEADLGPQSSRPARADRSLFEDRSAPVTAPVASKPAIEAALERAERRVSGAAPKADMTDEAVVPRRRASDWRQDDSDVEVIAGDDYDIDLDADTEVDIKIDESRLGDDRPTRSRRSRRRG